MTATPFRRGRVFWARVPLPGHRSRQQSLGTHDRREAKDVADFLRLLDRKRTQHAWLLTELATGAIPIYDAFTAYAEERLSAFVAEIQQSRTDTSLVPWLEKWQRELARRKTPVESERDKYLRQVKTLIGRGLVERPSQLTSLAVREWLTELDVGQSNRYRAAMSSFCRFLVESNILPANPVGMVRPQKESAPRDAYLDVADALTLCQTMPAPFNAFHAALVVTGMDVMTAIAVNTRDIDRVAGTVRARGSKGKRRDRTCIVYPVWEETWSITDDYLRANPSIGTQRAFRDVTYRQQRSALQDALKVQQIDDYLTKDHRHTCAVGLAKAGQTIQEIANQLGNDPAITARVYAKYLPTSARLKRAEYDRSATKRATGTD